MSIHKLTGLVRKAIDDFDMIQAGDKVAVGLSGGKDSITLLTLLAHYKTYAPTPFELVAITVDMNNPNTSKQEEAALREYVASLNVDYIVEPSDIYNIVFEIRKEKNPCSLCAKLRRGILNTVAIANGCNKIALGHHADDLMETLLLSMSYEGRLSTFSPCTYMSRTQVTLIRPMLYLYEKNVRSFAKDLPIVHNPCPADKHTQREYMKQLVAHIQQTIPFVKERFLSAITNADRYNLFPHKQPNQRYVNKTQDCKPCQDKQDCTTSSQIQDEQSTQTAIAKTKTPLATEKTVASKSKKAPTKAKSKPKK